MRELHHDSRERNRRDDDRAGRDAQPLQCGVAFALCLGHEIKCPAHPEDLPQKHHRKSAINALGWGRPDGVHTSVLGDSSLSSIDGILADDLCRKPRFATDRELRLAPT
jgi:hypothetical protein